MATKAEQPVIVTPVNVEKRRSLDIRAGDTVRVSLRIEEKGKTRLQNFEGLVIATKHGKEAGGTFTVRRVSSGVGVEKTFPIYSPVIEEIEIVKRSKVRRAKLYHIKKKATREIKRQMRRIINLPDVSRIDSQEEEAPVAENGQDATTNDVETTETTPETQVPEATPETEEVATDAPQQEEAPAEDVKEEVPAEDGSEEEKK